MYRWFTAEGEILYGAGRNYGIAVTWDWVYKTHLRVTTAGCGCGPLALCTASLVLALSLFFSFLFFYINYFCAVGAEGCDSTSKSKGSCRCSEQLDGHSAPSQRVGFFSLHDVGDIVQTIQNNRGLFVEHDTWLVNVRAAFMIVPLDEFHIISDAGNSRCVIFLFQVHYIDITWGILHQIIQE